VIVVVGRAHAVARPGGEEGTALRQTAEVHAPARESEELLRWIVPWNTCAMTLSSVSAARYFRVL
jgi:hypothetical protein